MTYLVYEVDGKIIKARVQQKTDTLANWLTNTNIILEGEQAFVVNDLGQPINFKIGDGTKTFSELPFWIQYDQAAYIPTYTATPTQPVAYTIVGAGTYGSITVGGNKLGILSWDGSAWFKNVEIDLLLDPDSIKKNDLSYTVGKNKLNINDLISDSAIGVDGILLTGGAVTGFKTSKPIPITDGVTNITISNDRKSSTIWNLTHRYRFLDSSGNYISGTVGQIDSTTTLPLTLSVGTAKYFQITVVRSGEVLNDYERVQVEYGNIATSFEPYVQKITKILGNFINNADKEVFTKTEVTSLVLPKADEINVNGKVVRSPSTLIRTYTEVDSSRFTGPNSGYWRYDNGLLESSTSRKVFEFDVDGLDLSKIAIDIIVSGGEAIALAVYTDENDVYIGYEQRVTSGTVQFTKHKLSPPSGTKKIKVTTINSSPYPKLYTYTETESYKEVLFQGDVYSNYEIDLMINNTLKGKKSLWLGDSIVHGGENGNISFADIISAKNNMTMVKRAVGGATVAVVDGSTNNIVKQVNDAVASTFVPDYIILDGLTNDITSTSTIQLGDISSGYSATLDTATFSGALEYIFKTLKTTYPQAKILYTRPHNMSSRDATKQVTFGNRALEICKKWSIPFVDSYNEGSLNTNIPIMQQTFTVATVAKPEGDGTHPNTLGYNFDYVPLVENKMKSI